MRTDIRRIAFAYLRLSNEEAAEGESSSIKNQRMIIQDYCERNEIPWFAFLSMMVGPVVTLTVRHSKR